MHSLQRISGSGVIWGLISRAHLDGPYYGDYSLSLYRIDG